jgi:hypothetical protein
MWIAWVAGAALGKDIVWSDTKYEIDNDTLSRFEDLELIIDDRFAEWFEAIVARSDKTPPEVRIWVVWEDHRGESHDEGLVTTTPRTISVPEGSTVVLFASANEVSGGALDDIQISGETRTSCEDGVFGQTASGLWFVNNPDPNPNDTNFYDWRLVGLDFPVPPFACQAGMHFVGGDGFFTATAVNHAGLASTTAPLTLEFLP